jgi:hypothetical protein
MARIYMMVVASLAIALAGCKDSVMASRAPLEGVASFVIPGNMPVTDTGYDLVPGRYYLLTHDQGAVCLERLKRCGPVEGSDVPGDEAWGLKLLLGKELVSVRGGAVISVDSAAPLTFYVAEGENLQFDPQRTAAYDDNSGSWEVTLTPFDAAPDPEWIQGVSVTSYTNAGYCAPGLTEQLIRIRGLGANAVQFVVVLATDGKAIFPFDYSPDIACLTRATLTASRLGFKVGWNLHVDPTDGGWRGALAPPDHKAFIEEYGTMARMLASLAQSYKVAYFVPATEMASLTRTQEDRDAWITVFRSLHNVYFGVITYGADKSEIESLDSDFWLNCCDAIGVTTWYTLTVDKAPTFEQLQASWRPIVAALEALANDTRLRIFVPEGPGYRAIAGCASEPADYKISGDASEMCQVTAYQSFLSTFTPSKRSLFWGSFLWEVTVSGEPKSDYSPMDRVTEGVLKNAWAPAPAKSRE